MMMEDQRLWSGGYLAHVAAWAIERGSHTNWLPINLTSGQSSLSCFPSSLAFVLFFVYSFYLLLSITYSVFLLALQIQVSSHSVFSIYCVSGWSPQVRTYLEILIFVSLGTPLTAHPNTQSDVAKPLISPAPIFFVISKTIRNRSAWYHSKHSGHFFGSYNSLWYEMSAQVEEDHYDSGSFFRYGAPSNSSSDPTSKTDDDEKSMREWSQIHGASIWDWLILIFNFSGGSILSDSPSSSSHTPTARQSDFYDFDPNYDEEAEWYGKHFEYGFARGKYF